LPPHHLPYACSRDGTEEGFESDARGEGGKAIRRKIPEGMCVECGDVEVEVQCVVCVDEVRVWVGPFAGRACRTKRGVVHWPRWTRRCSLPALDAALFTGRAGRGVVHCPRWTRRCSLPALDAALFTARAGCLRLGV
jgi:hypothetical protein